MGEFAGKVALVTGGASGIGKATAWRLAGGGARVVICGRRADAVAAAVAEGTSAGLALAGRPADVTVGDDMERLVAFAAERFGGLDILVNNAGIQFVSPVGSFPVGKWNDIIAINLSSAFHTIRAALPGMVEHGWGRIVNIASAHALVASPFKAAYVAAKHGLAGLTKSVALEVAEMGVTVNAIAPGYVETPLVRGQIADTAKARGISEGEVVRDVMLQAQPTRKLVTIDQVADLALYLCSDSAAAITGAVLPIDGGWTAR